jgi:hypothetical protein
MGPIDIYTLVVGLVYPVANASLAVITFLGYRKQNSRALLILCLANVSLSLCGVIYGFTRFSYFGIYVLPKELLSPLFFAAIPFELGGMILTVIGISMLCFKRIEGS